jgi:hypothetical protein
METTEEILDYQLTHGVFDNAKFSGTEGIAKHAVAQGFSTLSPKQKGILEPYLSTICSGVTDPGGYHNGCQIELEGESLLDAYQRCDDTECLVCDSCNDEEAEYARQWEKISQE